MPAHTVPFSVEPLYLTFTSKQLVVQTEVPEAHAFVARQYRWLLTSSGQPNAGKICITASGSDLHVQGLEEKVVPRQHAQLWQQQIKYEVLMHFMRARPDLLWLHAAAAARGSRAVVLSGAWGSGKSTLTAHLLQSGWTYLSDDIAPLNMDTGEVLPFPQTPMRRRVPTHEIPREQVPMLEKEEIPLAQQTISRVPCCIDALFLPHFDADTKAELAHIKGAQAVLLLVAQCLNFQDHQEKALAYLGQLCQKKSVFSLPYRDSTQAASLIEKIL